LKQVFGQFSAGYMGHITALEAAQALTELNVVVPREQVHMTKLPKSQHTHY